jgi:GNAT superfamily N-acetyltransferase
LAAAPFTIGQATAADVPALVALLAELFSIEQDFKPNPEKQQAGLEQLLAVPDRAAVMVARDAKEQLIAMVTAQLVISTAEGAPSAWIEDMVVAKSHRRGGVGRALLEAALDWAKSKGATRAQLLVDLENAPALAYYERLGWQATRLAARRSRL